MPRYANSPSWQLMLHVAGVVAGRGWRRHMKDRNRANGTLRGIYDRSSDIRAAGIEDNLRRLVADAQKDNRRRYWAREAELTAALDAIDKAQHDREYLRGRDARGPDLEAEAIINDALRPLAAYLKDPVDA